MIDPYVITWQGAIIHLAAIAALALWAYKHKAFEFQKKDEEER